MYAVVALQGHQYILSQGLEFVVDQVNLKEGETLNPEVLAIFSSDGSKLELSPEKLKDTVVCSVLSHQKAKKIRVLKFKRKNRYERNFGHRSYQTTLSVTSING